MGSWPSSSSARVGWPLVCWAAGALLAAFALGKAVSLPPWGFWALLAAAAAAGLRAALAPPHTSVGFWGLLGFCLVAAALCRQPPVPRPGQRLPVRFTGVVRDGFERRTQGWATRLALTQLEGASLAQRQLTLVVGGSAHPGNLPVPGSRLAGAGELVGGPSGPWLWVKSPLLLTAGPPAGIDHWRERAREKLAACAGFSLARQRAATLASALVLGRREGLSAETLSSLRAAGLAHILAVSGLHVGLVAGGFWLLFLLLGLKPQGRRWLLISVVVGFAWLAGGAPSVRRAATAALLVLLAQLVGRPVELLPACWGVVGLLVVLEPAVAWQPAFQLSAVTALALVRWAGPAAAPLGGGKLASALAVATVAQLASSPLVGMHFAAVPALAMPLNLLAVPLAAGAVMLALAAVALTWVLPAVAAGLLDVLAVLTQLLGLLASAGEKFSLPFPRLSTACACVLVAGLWLAVLPGRVASWALAGVSALTLCCLAWPFAPKDPLASITMVPVRQGMALLLAGERGQVLVDTGRGEREVVGLLARRRGAAALNALVLTHPDADHTGGAAFVLQTLRPEALCLPKALASRTEWLPLRWQAEKLGIPVRELASGQRLHWGDVACDVLWPPTSEKLSDNDASLVLRCQLAGASLLLVGDLERQGEEALLAIGGPLRADVLQVGHHGSKTSSSAAFLQAVSPRLALVPTGLSPSFPFPHPQVMARLRAQRAQPLVQRSGAERISILPSRRVRVEGSVPVFLELGQ